MSGSILSKTKKKKLAKSYPLLKMLSSVKDSEREKIIPFLNNEACSDISECILNILHGSHLDKSEKMLIRNKLQNSQKSMRYMANQNKPIHLRRKRMEQSGGAIGVVLASILPVIASLIVDQLMKK